MTQNDHYFMQLAIKEAKNSKHRDELDPKVGAVLSKDEQLIGSAHRGQIAKGDHAEFTLLQKILRSKDILQGSTLFTTLEPCTTRSHQKLPCAKWIVQKGIRRVVIGILDPNPTICGRGYWHLVDTGIDVEFFPTDLAKQIQVMNKNFIQEHRGGSDIAPAFAWEIRRMQNVIISPYSGMGWSDNLSLQDCPNLREGWPLSQIPIKINEDASFQLPKKYQLPYKDYYQRFYDVKRFQEDGEKFMLAKNPIAFSDAPSLSLIVRPTKYSEQQFYCDTIAKIPAERDLLIEDFVRGSQQCNFAHAFCMSMILISKDNKILLTKRSPKVQGEQGTWSVSAEEQLSRKDFEEGQERATLNWGRRLIREELGLSENNYHIDSLRLLSVFLEADKLNAHLCVYAEVQISSDKIDTILRGLPRTDYEFTDWTFIDSGREDLLVELFQASRKYHSTGGFRLLYTFLKQYGSPKDSEIYNVTGRN